MLLHEADEQGNRFWLGWVLESSGILATMAANLAYGARYGITGALIWGWPAYSFVLVAAPPQSPCGSTTSALMPG